MTTAEYLRKHLLDHNFHRVVIITDENVNKLYHNYFDFLRNDFEVRTYILPAVEASKSIETVIEIWNFLAKEHYNRDTFLVNFGGGMVCDIGGFVASTFKRGLNFANFPTTLLSMIDASIGGKTAINIKNIKNAIGTFYFPDIILEPDLSFLKTLPNKEIMSGVGELVKYALLFSKDFFSELLEISNFKTDTLNKTWIKSCIEYKLNIVRKDPKDINLRHILNFGHTLGHAFESYYAQLGKPIAHGLAVAQGLYYECYLSYKLAGLPEENWKNIAFFLKKHFEITLITECLLKEISQFLINDKKNSSKRLNFTLLSNIGNPVQNFELSIGDLNKILLK